MLVKGCDLPRILAKLIERGDDAFNIATQLTLKYDVLTILAAVEEICEEPFVKWIDVLLANKIFKCTLQRDSVKGIMQKMFLMLKTSTEKGMHIYNCIDRIECVYGIIAKLNGMLETEQFVEMCCGLMQNRDSQIKNNALTLFAEKSTIASETSAKLYTGALRQLVAIVETDSENESRQNALVCVCVLIKTFGKNLLDAYMPLFTLGCNILNTVNTNDNVLVSTLTMISLLTYVFNQI